MSLSDWQVLVVDDEQDSLELVHGILEYQGVPLIVGHRTADEALKTIRDMKPTLIIIDLALPGMDGWSLLTELRKQPHLTDVPCVAITSYHTMGLANKAIEAGFDAYFPKPINATSFVRELESIVYG